jgi:hypothetical protein
MNTSMAPAVNFEVRSKSRVTVMKKNRRAVGVAVQKDGLRVVHCTQDVERASAAVLIAAAQQGRGVASAPESSQLRQNCSHVKDEAVIGRDVGEKELKVKELQVCEVCA